MKHMKFIGILLVLVLLCGIQALAADTPTPAPADTDITIKNNLSGTPDTVVVNTPGLKTGDIVRVYSTDQSPVPIGIAVASVNSTATVYISQLGIAAGTVYVSVTSGTSSESTRTPKDYDPETRTDAPKPANITVINNLIGTLDQIIVTGLNPGDVVRAYTTSIGSVVLATGISSTDTATLYLSQLGVNNGTVWISAQGPNQLESTRTAANYTTELSSSLSASNVKVKNNFFKKDTDGDQIAGTEDTVTVSGVVAGDTLTLYSTPTGSVRIGLPMTLPDDFADTDITIPVSQLGTKAGKIYISITKPGKAESKLTAISYDAEPVTQPPLATNISVENNYNTPDAITILKVPEDYVVTAYATATIVTPLKSAKATSETVTLGLGLTDLSPAGGKVYLTFTSPDANESVRVPVTYVKEVAATAPTASNVVIVNNYDADDTVTVNNLATDDVVSIYLTVTDKTPVKTSAKATGTSVTITLEKDLKILSSAGGKLYVTITSATAGESNRTAVTYPKETFSNAPAASSVKVVNNCKTTPDTVTVSNLKATDTAYIYTLQTGGKLIGQGTPGTGNTSVDITIPAGTLSAAGGRIYVSVKAQDANESTRTAVSYDKEAATAAPLVTAISVDNYSDMADSMTVSGLSTGDVVKVYTKQTGTDDPIKTSDPAGGTSVTIPFSSGLLSSAGGKLYVSVTSSSASESTRTLYNYPSDKTSAPLASSVVVVNNYFYMTGGAQDPASRDSVTVKGVLKDDTITLYATSSGKNPMLTPVQAMSDGDVTIPIDQLGTAAGRLYVSIKSMHKNESVRTPVPYAGELITAAVDSSSIIVQNNYQLDDTITITGVKEGQTVSVYTTQTGVPAIASIVSDVSTVKFTIKDGILAAAGGRVYVSVKDADKLESPRTPQVYTAETSLAPAKTSILVVNYPGDTLDTVTIIGLNVGDTVTVYDTAGDILASETVAGKGTTITLTAKLNDTGGTVYVTVTGAGKAESKKTPVTYGAS